MTEASPKQTAQIHDWLELAPTPAPLAEQESWHVFLSYRSVNRNWVLHLYDALLAAGFKVFLDQLEIAVGDSLPRRLNNALARSRAGVIVWSSRYEDSEWCQSEHEAMEAMRKDQTFRFVIAKLDGVELPSFVKKDVYVDFSAFPHGPQGGELIRLMYGLVGKPAPKEVLLKAQAIDDGTKRAIAAIDAARETGNVKKLLGLAREAGEIWQASPLLYCAVAEALIGMEEYQHASEVLQSTAQFETAIRPIQLKALAFARKAKLISKRAGDTALSDEVRAAARDEVDTLLGEAQQSLGELYALGHRDPETLGIYARTWMDRYNLSGQRAFLERSRNLYKLAFELDNRDFYTGINAAAKSVLLGELEVGAALATQVQGLVGTKAVPKDYWKTATVAEVQLLQCNYAAAAALYRAAVTEAPLAIGDHSSSRGQAALILAALQAPQEAGEKVLAAFVL
jgi:hypothetical protein